MRGARVRRDGAFDRFIPVDEDIVAFAVIFEKKIIIPRRDMRDEVFRGAYRGFIRNKGDRFFHHGQIGRVPFDVHVVLPEKRVAQDAKANKPCAELLDLRRRKGKVGFLSDAADHGGASDHDETSDHNIIMPCRIKERDARRQADQQFRQAQEGDGGQ